MMTVPPPEPIEVWESALLAEPNVPTPGDGPDDPDLLVGQLDTAHAAVCREQRRMLSIIARADLTDLWRDWGAHDMAHWLSMRYAISWWHARRWVRAAHALDGLSVLPQAFERGELGLESTLELCRFATPETEQELVAWARTASKTAIRRRADRESRRAREDAEEAERVRSVSWWYFDDGRRFGLQADLPAADGAVVAKALDRLAAEIPPMPDEHDEYFVQARRADALVALASARIAIDADPDRATVVIHARMEDLVSNESAGDPEPLLRVDAPESGARVDAPELRAQVGARVERAWPSSSEIDGGPVIGRETVQRLACTARIQGILEDAVGDPLGLGRLARDPAEWMLRQLRHRDGGCVFPGCGNRRFAHAHHIEWWSRGGRTDLPNLALVCTFHHKLVHEYGWRITRSRDGTIRWFRPDGTDHVAGPPESIHVEPQPAAMPP